jgi:hypothetical protein
MKTFRTYPSLAFSTVSLVVAACGQAPPGDSIEEINVNPASLNEATQMLRRIDELEKLNPQDPRPHEAFLRMQPKLDELNHLVARLEPKPGHFVSFYGPQKGVVIVTEAGPAKEKRLLGSPEVDSSTFANLYRYFSKGAEPPEVLIRADEQEARAALAYGYNDPKVSHVVTSSPSPEGIAGQQQAGGEDIGTSSEALTQGDGQFFADNFCFKSGDNFRCVLNWFNGGAADAPSKASFFSYALFQGAQQSVVWSYSGQPYFILTISNGEVRTAWAHSAVYDDCFAPILCAMREWKYFWAPHRWEFLEASGKGSHWSWSFQWSCDSANACAHWPQQ